MSRRKLISQVGAIAILMAIVMAFSGQHAWQQTIGNPGGGITTAFPGWQSFGWVGLLLAQVMIAVSGVLPASLIGISAGAAYGVTLGFAMSSTILLAGAIIAFVLSRSLLRSFIECRLRGRPRLSNFDQQIRTQGWKLVCLLRLSPIMPFAATSYLLGLSSITFEEYVVGTLASLPSLLGYVLVGVLIRTGASVGSYGPNSIRYALLAIGALAMTIVMMQVVRLLQRAGLVPGTPSDVPSCGIQ